MKKNLSILFMLLAFCLNAFSQATSLTVDCQNPGWLSSKINYGDQLTVEDLNVTGYLNSNDLSFIGSLLSQKLTRVTLDNANIVDTNTLPAFMFQNNGHIQYLSLPLSITDSNCCLQGDSYLNYVDTLVVGGENMPVLKPGMFYRTIYQKDGIRFNKSVKCLIIREGTTTIDDFFAYNVNGAPEEDCIFASISFPSTLKIIGKNAFTCCYKLICTLPDCLEEIGEKAFQLTPFEPDTLRLPKNMKTYYTYSFPNKMDQVIYIPENLTSIVNGDDDYLKPSVYNIVIHSEAKTPPSITGKMDFGGAIVYVPKGSKKLYEVADYWKNATIIENILVEDIKISNLPTGLYVGDNIKLDVDVSPSDALDKNYTLLVSDENVATISEDGTLTALKNGEVTITATSSDGAVTKKITLNIYDHTTGVAISKESLTMSLGATETLSASTLPLETSDGKVKWKSADEKVAIVNDKGTVVAVGYGTTVIIVTSVDGDYIATCTVQVTEGTDINTINTLKNRYIIYDINGIERKELKIGINIIKFDDGTIKKIVIK